MKTTDLATFSRPGVVRMLAEIGLMLGETTVLLAKLQASMLCGQVAAHAAYHRVCAVRGVVWPLKDRLTSSYSATPGACLLGKVRSPSPSRC